jgi:tetratricopeptide (TPR) repeat protein
MTDSRVDGGVPAACLDDETVASFVEGTIDAEGRTRVVAHVATCADCYELVAEVLRLDSELQPKAVVPPLTFPVPAPTAAPARSNRRMFVAAAGILAVAASVLFVVSNRGSQLDPLVEIVGNERLTLARPTGGFRYGALKSPVRGSGSDENYTLLAEAATLRERAERTNAAGDLHAAGVAQLLVGDDARGITLLESAVTATPDDARFRADLGAAYMSRFANRGNDSDAEAALAAFDQALAELPTLAEAWFNKAVLLERMNRPKEALTAWDRYLALPAEEGWREEAVRSREGVARLVGGG